MNAKQWLGRARHIKREIDLLRKTKEKAFDDVTKITQSYESDGAQTSKDPHKFDRLVEFEGTIDEMLDELYETETEILRAILELEDRRQKYVLIAYYINMQTIEKIAVEMNYSFRQITNIRRRGIQEIGKRIGDKMK
jgi:DNA-directed RNA polymerase specialized sigma24 family protein